MRLSSRACFNVNISPEEEKDVNLPKKELSASLEDDSLQITACGDEKHQNTKSPEENTLSVVSGTCLQSRDIVLNCEYQNMDSVEVASGNLSCEELLARKFQLQKDLKEKQECLRKLRMVKLYRSKVSLQISS